MQAALGTRVEAAADTGRALAVLTNRALQTQGLRSSSDMWALLEDSEDTGVFLHLRER